MRFLFKSNFIIFLFFATTAFTLPQDTREQYKICRIHHLSYKQTIPESRFKNLKMIGTVNKFGVQGKNKQERLYGAILRALRFQNITRKVEKKYGLSKNLLLAMIMQESGGVDILPNGRNDGGAGLCHMQPMIAKDFGLKVYQNCNKMVSKVHGRALRRLIVKYKSDRKKLIKFDDRFHPIKNIDAVARILQFYKNAGFSRKIYNTQEKRAIRGYTGKYNFKKYYSNLKYYQRMLNNKKVINEVRKMFNKKNKNFLIDGKKGNFDSYIKAHQKQNINYGLNRYK